MYFGIAGIRSEEEYFRIVRDRTIECLCRKLLQEDLKFFHAIDMIRDCVKSVFDEEASREYEFSEEQEYYTHVLQRIYRPLVERNLMDEYENNNFGIPSKSRLRNICASELRGKDWIIWDKIDWNPKS